MDFEEIVKDDEPQSDELRNHPGCGRTLLQLSLFLLAPILLVIVLLPTLLSSDGGRRWALEKINAATPGKFTFERWRLGWLRAPELMEVTYARENMRIKADRVTFDRGLLRLLPIGVLNLGKVTLENPQVELSLLPQAAERDLPKGEKSSGKGGFFLPVVDAAIDLQVVNGTLCVVGQAREAFTVERIEGAVGLTSWRKPIKVQTRMRVGDGLVALEGNAQSLQDMFTERKEPRPEKLSLTVVDVDVAAFRPLLQHFIGDPLVHGGKAEGAVNVTLSGKKEGRIEGGLAVSQLVLEARDGMAVPRGDIALLVNSDYDKHAVNIVKFELNSPWARAEAQGRLQGGAEQGRVTGAINGRATIGLAAVARDFAAPLRLSPALQVDGGELRLNLALTGLERSLRVQVDAVTAALAMRIDGEPFELKPAPSLECKVDIPYGGLPEFELLHLKAPFLDLYVKGRYDAAQVKAQLDLTRFARDARRIVKELPPMVGLIYMDATTRRDKDNAAFASFIKLSDVAVELHPGQMTVVPQATLKFDGAVPVKSDRPQPEIRDALFELTLANSKAGGGWQRFKPAHAAEPLVLRDFKFSGDMEIGALRRLLGGFIAAGVQQQIAGWQGRVAANVTAEAAGGAVKSHFNAAGMNILAATEDGVWQTPDVRFAGTIAQAAADKPLQVDLKGEGSAKLERDGATIFVEPAATLAMQCALAANGRELRITQWDATTSLFDLRASGAIDDLPLSRRLRANGKLTVDMAGVSQLLATRGMEWFKFTGREARAFTVDTSLANGLASVLGEGEVVAPVYVGSCKGQGLSAGPAEMVFKLTHGSLKIAYEPPLNGGRLRLVPQVAVGGKGGAVCEVPPRTRVLESVKLTQEMVDTWLVNMNPLFHGAKILDGAITLDMAGFRYDPAATPEKGIFADMSVTLTNLKLEHGPTMLELLSKIKVNQRVYEVQRLPAHIVVRNGAIQVDPVRMEFDRQPVSLSGTVTFDGVINYLIEVPVTEQMVGKAVAGMLKGTVIKIPVTGTVDNPRLDTRALLKMLGSALGESIKSEAIDKVGGFLEQLQRELRK